MREVVGVLLGEGPRGGADAKVHAGDWMLCGGWSGLTCTVAGWRILRSLQALVQKCFCSFAGPLSGKFDDVRVDAVR